MRYAALLRGINVGGRKKVPMAVLRAMLADLGYADVVTHLQSGNAVFTSQRRPQALSRAIAERIAGDLGMDVKVIIRTGGELADVIARSPLPDGPPSPSRYFVAFLSAEPPQAEAEEVTSMTFDPDQIWISGAEAFLWCPAGVADTRLTNSFLEKRLQVTATSRNWNTVLKLAELTRG